MMKSKKNDYKTNKNKKSEQLSNDGHNSLVGRNNTGGIGIERRFLNFFNGLEK